MKMLVTGSRDHDPEWVASRVSGYILMTATPEERVTIIHGDATGADQGAHLASLRTVEAAEVRVPAQWQVLGKRAGPRRNVEMLDEYKPDVVLAFPLGESRGTHNCMSEAEARGIPVVVFEVKR